MKRISALILTAIILISGCVGVSASSAGLFSGLNLLPELSGRADSDLVRRDEFAAVAGALNGFTMQAPSATAFTDVTEENPYSGMIRFLNEAGILAGVSETSYLPEESLTYKQALTAYVKLLGYRELAEKRGGYPNGYVQVAANLELFDRLSVPVDTPLTFGQLWELTDWALEVETPNVVYGSQDGELIERLDMSEDGQTLLEKNLKLTAYEAFVDAVDAKDYGVTVTITRTREDAAYQADEKVYFSAPTTLNLLAYDKAPVKIWVNSEDELLYITLQRRCEVRYGVVYSVNNDTSTTARYQVGALSDLMFWDDEEEYAIHEDGLSFYYNDAPFTGSIALAGRYVRMVLREGDIVSMETWDFAEGGIVSEITFKAIQYTKGDTMEQLRDLEQYEKQVLILDGEIRDMKDLKTDTLIDYYISSDKKTLVLLGSEKKITEELKSIGGGEMQIGNLLYMAADTLYSTEDGEAYKTGNEEKLLGTKVTARIDSYGRVRYLAPAGEVTKNDFIGYLTGVRQQGPYSQKEIRVVDLEDSEFASDVYNVSEKLVVIGSTPDDVYATANDVNGMGVYRFKKNADGEITEISKLNPYHGFDADGDGLASASISSFMQSSYPYVTIDSKRLYIDSTAPITGMYMEDGALKFVTSNWSTLNGADASVRLYVYGPEQSSDYDLLLMTGDLSTIQGTGRRYGVVDSVTSCILDNGEEGKRVTIGGTDYYVTNDVAEGLKKNTFVKLKSKIFFGGNDLEVIEKFDLSGDIFSWVGKGSTNIQMQMGTVSKIDDKRIYFDDGSALYLRPEGYTVLMQNAAEKLTTGNMQDPLAGRSIVYALDNSTAGNPVICAVFYAE